MDPEAMVEFLPVWVVVDDILICESGLMWEVLLLVVGDRNRAMGKRLVWLLWNMTRGMDM